jgi:hypothetical protein
MGVIPVFVIITGDGNYQVTNSLAFVTAPPGGGGANGPGQSPTGPAQSQASGSVVKNAVVQEAGQQSGGATIMSSSSAARSPAQASASNDAYWLLSMHGGNGLTNPDGWAVHQLALALQGNAV